MPNFEAIGKCEYYKKQASGLHEKRRKWAHEIAKIVEPLRQPGINKDIPLLNKSELINAVEELVKFNDEIESARIELDKANKELNNEA